MNLLLKLVFWNPFSPSMLLWTFLVLLRFH